MKVLDLFSGIGGFSLGLERAGMRTVAFCEIDPFCRRVLARHWPGVPIYDDIEGLGWERLCADELWPGIDVIAGGFPCQDISLAGTGAGLEGDRSGLYWQIWRLIRELRPSFVILENVAALLNRGLDDVLRSLASIGYDAEWHCIPASAVGAPHIRDRIWIVAYPSSFSGDGGRTFQPSKAEPGPVSTRGQGCNVADTHNEGTQRGEQFQKGGGGSGHVADTNCVAAFGPAIARQERRDWFPEPNVGRVAARVSTWLDDSRGVTLDEQATALARAQGVTKDIAVFGCLRAMREYGEAGASSHTIRRPDGVPCSVQAVSRQVACRRASGETYETMRDLWNAVSSQPFKETQDVFQRVLERVGQEECAKALGSRVDRLRSLGNAVVPYIPEIIGRAIMQAEASG